MKRENDLSKKYCIYQHKNITTGQSYIGQALMPISNRWKGKEKAYINCSKFYNALCEYGWDGFEHNILEDNLSLQEANEKEVYYINYFNAINNGYNIRLGGNNGGNWSQEAKEHFSTIAKNKQAWVGDKNPRHIHPLVGAENGMYGKHHSDITKQKISEKRKGTTVSFQTKEKISKFMNEQHPRAKKVLCLETNEVFLSARKAALYYNCGNSTISRVCNGQRESFHGLHFKYISEEEYNILCQSL